MSDFWKNKRVLITGHTGFKGSWLSIYLLELGASVIGYSLDPATDRDNFVLCDLQNKLIDIRGDIRDLENLEEVFHKYQPQIVFHLAAQPLVGLSYDNPIYTYETNFMGTLNVLECIKRVKSAKVGIMVTSDKCYYNQEQIWGYRENDRMGGYDPYSSSKACAELLVDSYRNSYFNPIKYMEHEKAIASVRAGNVIGGGDWSKNRIIPDCIRAIEQDIPIGIRNPQSIRPWQHVLEPLSGYIMLAEKIYYSPIEYSGGWNFGPEDSLIRTVWNMAELVVDFYGRGVLEDLSEVGGLHEANLLTLDITKAKTCLKWKPKMSIEDTMDYTINWYKNYKCNNIFEICVNQITNYINL